MGQDVGPEKETDQGLMGIGHGVSWVDCRTREA
jgi:hypothetical protein